MFITQQQPENAPFNCLVACCALDFCMAQQQDKCFVIEQLEISKQLFELSSSAFQLLALVL